MGRRKIEIQPITHERNRSVTFLKRKNGLFKKAYELGVLCSVDVAVIIFEERPGHHLKLYQYGSSDIHDIIQRHLRHEGEKDTRGPADFSGNTSNAKDEVDDEDGDEEPDDAMIPSIRGSTKRRADGPHKSNDMMSPNIDYIPPRTSIPPQHPPRLLPPSMSSSQHHHQHPVSSDRLGGGAISQHKKPRLGIPQSGGIGRSRSSDEDLMSGSGSPVSSSRSSRYPDIGGRNFAGPGYPMSQSHHVPHSAHPNNSSSTQQRQHHSQYAPFFPSNASGGSHYGPGSGTPPPPNFIPLQSQADFSASVARTRSGSGGSSGVLSSRNVFGGYGGDAGGPPGSGGGGPGGGASGDLFAAFMDAEHQARVSIRRGPTTGPGMGGGGGSPFGLDWPVHMPSGAGHGGDNVGSKPGSHSSTEREGRRERGASAGSGGSASGTGSGSGPGSGADWLDFLSGTTATGAAAG